MSKVNSKYIDFGTTGNKVNAADLPANHTPANYTASSDTSSHLSGIDAAIGSIGVGTAVVLSTSITSATTGTWSTATNGSPKLYARFWDNSASEFYVISVASLDLAINADGNSIDYDTTGLTFDTNDYLQLIAHYITGTTVVNNSSEGDISETSFSAAASQTSQNVTGFAFANASIRSFEALVSVEIDATSNLYESFKIQGIQRDSDWVISTSSIGDDSEFSFSITSAGQIQYSSAAYTGFSSATIKFRALVTNK